MNSKKENIDKKIERIHWNLKYKRKFLRILWLIPGYVFALLLMGFSEMQDAYIYYFLISYAFSFIAIVLLFYTFFKWICGSNEETTTRENGKCINKSRFR